MNYLKEIIAFHTWLETNQLDATEQCLWFHLLEINNKCCWTEWFAVANMTLQARLGVDRKTLDRKRLKLVQAGRIEYRSQGTKKAGKYRIISFGDVGITGNIPLIEGKSVPNDVPNTSPKVSTLNKLNKTKQNKDNISPLTPQKKGGRKADPRIKQIIDYYHERFVEKFGNKPVINGSKDGAIIKKLLETHELDKLLQLLNLFFASKDPWVQNSGYTIGVFKSQINKLLVQAKGGAGSGQDSSSENKDDIFIN